MANNKFYKIKVSFTFDYQNLISASLSACGCLSWIKIGDIRFSSMGQRDRQPENLMPLLSSAQRHNENNVNCSPTFKLVYKMGSHVKRTGSMLNVGQCWSLWKAVNVLYFPDPLNLESSTFLHNDSLLCGPAVYMLGSHSELNHHFLPNRSQSKQPVWGPDEGIILEKWQPSVIWDYHTRSN